MKQQTRFDGSIARTLAVAAMLILVAGIAAAQPDPTRSRGFVANKQFDFHGVDAINGFNGNLVLTVPLGSPYTVGDGLSYSFGLNYNASIWDYERRTCAGSIYPTYLTRYFWDTLRHVIDVQFFDRAPKPIATNGAADFCAAESVPSPHANAGLGWFFTLGSLALDQEMRLSYISPDGGEHSFFEGLNGNDTASGPGYMFTRDGSYYRLRLPTSENREAVVESPDGVKRTYFCPPINHNDSLTGCKNDHYRFDRPHWKLRRIEDPRGNAVNITYQPEDQIFIPNDSHFDPSLRGEFTGEYSKWTVREEGTEREHIATFEPQLDIPSRVRLAQLDLASSGPGDRAVYTFNYDDKDNAIYRDKESTCYFLDDCEIPYLDSGKIVVPILKTITLPDGSTWRFDSLTDEDVLEYPPSTHRLPSSETAGRLAAVTLPTGGSIQYEYGPYRYLVKSCNNWPNDENPGHGPPPWFNFRTGVRARRELLNGVQTGRWLYSNSVLWPEPEPYQPCNLPRTMNSFVVDPVGKVTVNYYSAYLSSAPGDPNPEEFQAREYGLPFSRAYPEPDSSPKRYLSQEVYECAADYFDGPVPAPAFSHELAMISPRYQADCANRACGCPKRQTYVRYENSGYYENSLEGGGDDCSEFGSRPGAFACTAANQRVASEKTVYLDDAAPVAGTTAAFSLTDRSGFDGLGHYRTIVTDGNFLWRDLTGANQNVFTDKEKRFTNYNPGSDVDHIPASATLWLLNTYTEMTAARLKANVPNDIPIGTTVNTKFSFNPTTGFLDGRRVLKNGSTPGSDDLLTLYTRTVDAGGIVQIVESSYGGDNGGLNGGGFTPGSAALGYAVRRRYQFGALQSSEYVTPSSGPGGFASLLLLENYSNSPATGQILTSTDSAGVVTTYTYDAMGRLKSEQPEEETITNYTWQPAEGSQGFKVTVDQAQGAHAEITYDGFGRVAREQHRFPSGGNQLNNKITEYLSTGQVKRVSTVGLSETPTSWTRYEFDVFGRPTLETRPDNKTTEYKYTGDRITSTKEQIGDGTVWTGELRDRAGRLLVLNDGLNNRWVYNYDVLGNLTSVESGVQTRTMSYDARGFLLTETLPELGAAGNGTRTFSNYDSRGHARRVQYSGDPNFTQAFQYDAAERLLNVKDNGARLLKELVYDNEGCREDSSKGKLRTATRYNYVPDPRATSNEMKVVVQDFYRYAGRGGRLSEVTTSVADPLKHMKFVTGYTYTSLGNVATIQYPQCGGCGLGPHARNLQYGYSNSGLTSVAGFADPIDYHPNGMLKRVRHLPGPQSWDEKVSIFGDQPRVRSISTERVKPAEPGGVGDWVTDDYVYDGVGNITKIGGTREVYKYDKVSRLISARISGVTQAYEYDAFGNMTRYAGTSLTSDSAKTERTNHLAQPEIAPMNPAVTYNAIGALTKWRDPRQTAPAPYSYGWDALGMIRQAQGPGLGKVFVYDANDQRIGVLDYKSAAPAVQELWSLRGANRQVLRDFAYSGSWSWKEDYIRRGDSLLATDSGGGTVKHYALDHLGTPRLITDGNGKKLVYRAYFPFGEEISPVTNPAIQPERMQFTGHERDDNDRAPGSQVGDLDYMHARYYGPMTGRFLSVDPGRDVDPRVPQSWNHYAYVRNSPVGTIDPTGLASQGGQAAQADLWHREEQARAEWQKAEQERAETCAAAEEHVDYRDLTNKIGPLSLWVWVELGPIGKVAKTTAIAIATPFGAAGGLVGDVTTLPLRPIPQVNQKLNDRFGNNFLGMTTMALGAMEKTLAHVWGGPHDGWVSCIRATHRAKDAQQAWSDQTVKFDIVQAWSLSQ